jgi:hypothetical protein
MKIKLSVRQNRTFLQRFNRDAIFWGIPMLCMDLLGVPLFGWGAILTIAVPATLVGILAWVVIEYSLVTLQSRQNEKRTRAGGTPDSEPPKAY